MQTNSGGNYFIWFLFGPNGYVPLSWVLLSGFSVFRHTVDILRLKVARLDFFRGIPPKFEP